MHLRLVELRALHEQLGACRSVAVVREISDLLSQHGVVDARGVDLHPHLP